MGAPACTPLSVGPIHCGVATSSFLADEVSVCLAHLNVPLRGSAGRRCPSGSSPVSQTGRAAGVLAKCILVCPGRPTRLACVLFLCPIGPFDVPGTPATVVVAVSSETAEIDRGQEAAEFQFLQVPDYHSSMLLSSLAGLCFT